MTTPHQHQPHTDGIPDDVWEIAVKHFDTMERSQEIPMLCRAILEERKRHTDGWQPIETAPKDGSFADLWHKDGVRIADCRWLTNRIGYTCWHAQQGGRAWNVGGDEQFTHWQPLPKPPSTTQSNIGETE